MKRNQYHHRIDKLTPIFEKNIIYLKFLDIFKPTYTGPYVRKKHSPAYFSITQFNSHINNPICTVHNDRLIRATHHNDLLLELGHQNTDSNSLNNRYILNETHPYNLRSRR